MNCIWDNFTRRLDCTCIKSLCVQSIVWIQVYVIHSFHKLWSDLLISCMKIESPCVKIRLRNRKSSTTQSCKRTQCFNAYLSRCNAEYISILPGQPRNFQKAQHPTTSGFYLCSHTSLICFSVLTRETRRSDRVAPSTLRTLLTQSTWDAPGVTGYEEPVEVTLTKMTGHVLQDDITEYANVFLFVLQFVLK